MPNLSRARCADLHMHTWASDGVLAPEALVELALRRGIQVIAVTDHDTIAGVRPAQEAGVAGGLRVIAGVEMSVDAYGNEVHLLGYGFDPEHPALRRQLDRFQADRELRARAMLARLESNGIVVPWSSVEAEVGPASSVGRPHVAAALVAEGVVASVPEAFDKFLRDDGPAFVPRAFPSAELAIELLHEAGGLAVIAHPGQWTSSETLRRLIDAGLDGIEAQHPSHDANLQGYYRDLAEREGLLATGGSDFHGRRPHESERLGTIWLPGALLGQLERGREVVAE